MSIPDLLCKLVKNACSQLDASRLDRGFGSIVLVEISRYNG
ncbi:hypothetical protein CKA32_002893 [Geitlerinema sp. FC II]|nr:hypothetical protein CKA32_002893 [Geitlerinema sp. FC II]